VRVELSESISMTELLFEPLLLFEKKRICRVYTTCSKTHTKKINCDKHSPFHPPATHVMILSYDQVIISAETNPSRRFHKDERPQHIRVVPTTADPIIRESAAGVHKLTSKANPNA
jgi:hypothetical protein